MWLAVDGPGGGTQEVSGLAKRCKMLPHHHDGGWLSYICWNHHYHGERYEASAVEGRRLCCLEQVTARCKYQQVDWQRVPTTFDVPTL